MEGRYTVVKVAFPKEEFNKLFKTWRIRDGNIEEWVGYKQGGEEWWKVVLRGEIIPDIQTIKDIVDKITNIPAKSMTSDEMLFLLMAEMSNIAGIVEKWGR